MEGGDEGGGAGKEKEEGDLRLEEVFPPGWMEGRKEGSKVMKEGRKVGRTEGDEGRKVMKEGR
jgi:hypothetical protein